MIPTLSVDTHVVGNLRARTDAAAARLRRVREATLLPEAERRARIAYYIRRGRERRGWSPPQVADAVGRSRGTVNDWESGKSTPSLADLGPICYALRLTPQLFVELPPIPDDQLGPYVVPADPVDDLVDDLVPNAEAKAAQPPKPTLLRPPKRSRRRPVEDPQ
jgi:transcriptional regulator with XRE-family HTH domain